MKSTDIHEQTFRAGSKTYYNASRFFPREVRDDVYLLYGFVRVADNFVDSVPQDPDGFHEFEARYRRGLAGETTGDPIIDGFVDLSRRRSFDPAWADAFLYSMRLDLTKRRYGTLDETLEYIYGSAEVIGLFMARMMDLSPESLQPARMLGRAMQFINFIRDIAEDQGLGREYLPMEETSLPDLSQESAKADPNEFRRFVRAQLERYRGWQREAESGYRFLPPRLRIPIRTAGDMYNWTGEQISRDPLIVYQRKVKPAKARIVIRGITNRLRGLPS